jgi:hypothetical protein
MRHLLEHRYRSLPCPRSNLVRNGTTCSVRLEAVLDSVVLKEGSPLPSASSKVHSMFFSTSKCPLTYIQKSRQPVTFRIRACHPPRVIFFKPTKLSLPEINTRNDVRSCAHVGTRRLRRVIIYHGMSSWKAAWLPRPILHVPSTTWLGKVLDRSILWR